VSEDELASLEQHVKVEVQEAARFADESPPADPEHLWDYVYADPNTDPRKM
jgi:TPP-dependent pyruvate/acetoin dehydrogenase alpha subunit